MAGIFDYRFGEFLREATDEEYERYKEELGSLTPRARQAMLVDGRPYGFPGLTIWMEE
jgi:hypothetical protein